MKWSDVETQQDKIDYYEELLDFLDDHVPCLDELVCMFEEEDSDED